MCLWGEGGGGYGLRHGYNGQIHGGGRISYVYLDVGRCVSGYVALRKWSSEQSVFSLIWAHCRVHILSISYLFVNSLGQLNFFFLTSSSLVIGGLT